MIFRLIEKINSIKKFPLYFITPTIYAIGNASEQINLAINYVKKRNKKLIILKIFIFPKLLNYSICNTALFNNKNFENKYISLNFFLKKTLNLFINIEFFIKRLIVLIFRNNFKIKFKENFIFPMIGINRIYGIEKINLDLINYDQIKKFEINYNLLNLSQETMKFCEEKIYKFGFSKNDKIVCLHVRDGDFRQDEHRKTYRNSDINNYLSTIQYLTEQGYKVVRLGKSSNKELKIKNKNFFDYTFSNIKEDILDLYFIYKCSFYIGTQSGVLDVAQMFNKPILITNMCELFTSFPRKSFDRGIFKKIISKKTGKEVQIKKFAEMDFKYHDPQVEIFDLEFKENTPQEILDATKEFINDCIDKNLINKKNKIQEDFNSFIRSRYRLFYENDFENYHSIKKQEDALKMIRIFKSFNGALCKSYLKNNYTL